MYIVCTKISFVSNHTHIFIDFRILIWSEVGKNPAIMKSQLDGKVKSLLINNDIQHPSSIAVDEPTDRLYWLDSVLDRIESIQLDGSDRQVLDSVLYTRYYFCCKGLHKLKVNCYCIMNKLENIV